MGYQINPELETQRVPESQPVRAAALRSLIPDQPKRNPEHRGQTYKRLLRLQASEALRAAPPSVYRLAVTVAMLAHPTLFASYQGLAEHSGLAISTVKKGLKELERIGLLPPDRKGWKPHARSKDTSWTRERPVCWEALGPWPDTQPRTGGIQVDTRGGVQVDTRKQQAVRTKEEEGFEGRDPSHRASTETRSDTRAVDLTGPVETQAELQSRIGFSPDVAGRLALSIGSQTLATILAAVEDRCRSGPVPNPAGLFMKILQSDYTPEYRQYEADRRAESRARTFTDRKQAGRGAPGPGRASLLGCSCGPRGTCAVCMPSVDSLWASPASNGA